LEAPKIIGFIIGLSVNVLVQISILRYFFVYYKDNGDKSRYLENKVAYNLFFGFIALIIWLLISSLPVVFVLIFILTILYFGVSLNIKWKNCESLPSPFRPDEGIDLGGKKEGFMKSEKKNDNLPKKKTEIKNIGIFLILAGGVILALKFINAILSFIISDFLLVLGTILLIGGAVILALKFVKENRDDKDDEPFRGIEK